MDNNKAQADPIENAAAGDNTTSDAAIRAKADLPESERDKAHLQPEKTVIDLPDVSDIPGQEHVHVAALGELADTTISSDDEEGEGLFDDDNNDAASNSVADADTEVSTMEKDLLEQAGEDMPTQDDIGLRRAALDKTDTEGAPINEGSLATDVSGADLDEAGDDTGGNMEDIGEEDEENNNYSLGSDKNDNVTEGTP